MRFMQGLLIAVLTIAQGSGIVRPDLKFRDARPEEISMLYIDGNQAFDAGTIKILTAELKKNGQLEVVKELSQISISDDWIMGYSSPPPQISKSIQQGGYLRRKVWKEIYEARGGKIILRRVIQAKIIPAQEERIEWPVETERLGVEGNK